MVDDWFLAWLHGQVCLVSGRWPVTAHHVRENGSPKNDRRTLALIPLYHLIQADPKQTESIEALGKIKWQARHGVDIEASIAEYNRRYTEETGRP